MSMTLAEKKALVLDALIQAAKDEGTIASEKNDDYHKGETMGWYRILSIIADEAEAYDMNSDDIGLKGFNPDSLLKPAKKAA